MGHQKQHCIVTVTTDNYAQWTMTMLYSFLETNPWFKGDIIIITDAISDRMCERFRIFSNVIWMEPSDLLKLKLDELCRAKQRFNEIKNRFLSLETFRIANYKKVLFLDSDMIVTSGVEELFSLPGDFYASPEICCYRGKGRDARSFESAFAEDITGGFIASPVNTGFMLISGNFLAGDHYPGLIELIEPSLWNDGITYTDERVINMKFNGLITLLDSRYNYRPRAARLIQKMDNINFESASIIHFFSSYKPWNFNNNLAVAVKYPDWIRAYRLWFDWYGRFLTYYHLKSKHMAYTDSLK